MKIIEVKTKKDLEDGILNAKWSTIDIPLINFNHFDVLDSIYFEKVETIECDAVEEKPKSTKNTMIQKIREGIRNGSIVKEYRPDGTYIWKKVRNK